MGEDEQEPPPSFASRRPAANSLPRFSIPPPLSRPHEIPRVSSEALSPLSSSATTGSSQSSQHLPAGTASYYSSQGGSWPTPGGGTPSSYTLSSSSTGNMLHHSASHHPLPFLGGGTPRTQIFSPTPVLSFVGRSPPPVSGVDGLSIPSSSDSLPSFSTSLGGGGGGTGLTSSTLPSHSGILGSQTAVSSSVSQAPIAVSAPSSSDSYRHSQSPFHSFPTPPSYPPTSTASQGGYPHFASHASPSHQPPPSTSAANSTRGLMSSQSTLSGMVAPTLGYGTPRAQPSASHHTYHHQQFHHTLSNNLHSVGPVMSNMPNPGSSMVVGFPSHQSGHGHSIYSHHAMHGHGHHGPPPSQERPFRCDQCNQSFNRNHDLKRHKRIHLAVKPFPCTFCEKSFSRKDALKRHRMVKGCGEGGKGTSDSTSGNRSPSASPDDRDDTTEASPRNTQV